jgi:(1->4)-alpha-D-glucan 1-alpha-D-glucosylmutase
MVIGEDLGNVAPRMREAMQDGNLLSYRRCCSSARRTAASSGPRMAAQGAGGGQHARPADAARLLAGRGHRAVARAGAVPRAAAHEQQVLGRAQDRARLLLALQHEGPAARGASVQPTSLPDATPAFVDAVYAFLARTPCWLVGVQLEDVTGQLLQVNVPGTTEDRFPNWRRKLSVTVEGLASDHRWASLAAVLRAERSGPTPQETAPLELPALDSANVPCGTYRVQFHKGLHLRAHHPGHSLSAGLGVSHLYSSPYLRHGPAAPMATTSSTTGQLNPEVGDAQAHARMCQALRRAGMGQILDVVPNHMGVLEADNAWWLDVLEHGRASSHAEDLRHRMESGQPEMTPPALLPGAGDHYGKVLEAGEIQLHFEGDGRRIRPCATGTHRFPIDPAQLSGHPRRPAGAAGARRHS